MTLTKTATLSASLFFTSLTLPLHAAHLWDEPSAWTHDSLSYEHRDYPLFSANELSLDLGGSYVAGERGVKHLFNTNIKGHRGQWGGNFGVNYFLTKNIGVGADINMPNNGGHLVDTALADLIVRWPLGNSGFAPYLLGGAGRTTDVRWEWVGQGGLGLEFRFNRNVGLFTDGRFIWPRHSADQLMLRAGIRVAI